MTKGVMAVIGHGFVGNAVDQAFATPDCERIIVDPKYPDGMKIQDLPGLDIELAFVAVPTPQNMQTGEINISYIKTVVKDLIEAYTAANKVPPILVIKSTVTPDYLTEVSTMYPYVVYNPEFLTERNAVNDFINADFHIFGGSETLTKVVFDFYLRHSQCKREGLEHSFFTDIATASLVKYTLNNFFNLKVLFFNGVYEIFENTHREQGGSWADFVKILQADPRMGKTHMMIPGPDGRYGSNGTCFPKDSNAFAYYAKKIGRPFYIVMEAIRSNEYFSKKPVTKKD